MSKYVLNAGGEPVPEPDLLKWATWIETANRHVAETTIGPVWVSTVFLGLDHNYSGEGPPILWESMAFGGNMDQQMMRCSGSREQAEAMHLKMVEQVKAKLSSVHFKT